MSFKDDIYQLSRQEPLQLSISRLSSIKNDDTMLTAEQHVFEDESHIDVSDDLIALEVDSDDLIVCMNDTVEHPKLIP